MNGLGKTFRRLLEQVRNLPRTSLSEAPDDLLVNGISLQRHIAGFTAGQITHNESQSPGLGDAVAYDGDHLGQATIYVYTHGLALIPNGPMSAEVMKEFDRATRDLITASRAQGMQVAPIERYATGTPDLGTQFLCGVFELSNEHGARRSFLYLTAAGNRFVKLRVTLPTSDPKDVTARRFADVVASRLWR